MEGFNKPDKIHALAISESWLFRTVSSTTKPCKEYHISNLPNHVREKIVVILLEKAKFEARNNGKNIEFVQESLRIAYLRLEIVLFIRVSKIRISKFI